MLTIVITYSFFFERITVGGGAGWDGVLYKEISFNFLRDFKAKAIDSYSFQRILPFAIINILIEYLGIDKTVDNISLMMFVVNSSSILVSTRFYFLLCKEFNFNIETELVGFCALFFSYPILKFMGYYPLLCDHLAFTIGLGMFYFWVVKKRQYLVLFSFVGAFVWPTLLIQGLSLSFFPNYKKKLFDDFQSVFKRKFIYLLISIPCILYLILCMSHIFWGKFKVNLHRDVTNEALIFLSMLCSLIYIASFLYIILNNFYDHVRIFVKKFEKNNLFWMICLYLTVKLIIYVYASSNTRHTVSALVFEILAESLQAPFSNVVSHFTYYGFGFILITMSFKYILIFIEDHGYGFLFNVILAFLLSIGNESRYLITFMPMIIIPCLIWINKLKVDKVLVFLIVAISLILSRFYFSLNVNNVLDWDRYMLSQGPWQSFYSYSIMLCIFILSFFIFLFLFNRYTSKISKNV